MLFNMFSNNQDFANITLKVFASIKNGLHNNFQSKIKKKEIGALFMVQVCERHITEYEVYIYPFPERILSYIITFVYYKCKP